MAKITDINKDNQENLASCWIGQTAGPCSFTIYHFTIERYPAVEVAGIEPASKSDPTKNHSRV